MDYKIQNLKNVYISSLFVNLLLQAVSGSFFLSRVDSLASNSFYSPYSLSTSNLDYLVKKKSVLYNMVMLLGKLENTYLINKKSLLEHFVM